MNRKQKGGSTSQLRIIAGRWRGRRFPVAEAPGLRPTGDRIRETLFNWLTPVIPGARCLDLFAGSGALGLEALSRGAATCDFVERDGKVAAALQGVLRTLQADGAEVHRGDADHFLEAPRGPYDLVFLDPPFADARLAESCAALQQSGCLAGEARIYLEYPLREEPQVPGDWQCLRRKKAGNVAYALFGL